MTKKQVSTARKFATGMFAVLVAGMMSFPSVALALDSGTVDGNEIANGTAANGEGSGGGSWSYDGADTIELNNFVGGTIQTVGDTIIELEGNNVVEGNVATQAGDLTINGDANVDGVDKPSLDVAGSKQINGDQAITTVGGISATNMKSGADKSEYTTVDGKGNLTISDANVTISATSGGMSANGGNLTIKDSKVARGAENGYLSIYAGSSASESDKEVLLQGSEIEATSVYSQGTLTIDNTNLTVTPDANAQKRIDEGTYEKRGYKWIETAVRALKGINLKGEQNGEVVLFNDEHGNTWYYLTTGEDYKVELKASATPAYWGKTKGMPATGDATMPLAVTLGIAAMAAAAMGVYSFRNRKAEDDSVK